MRIRFDSQTGSLVPTPETALESIHAHLTAQQALWAEQLAQIQVLSRPWSPRSTWPSASWPTSSSPACSLTRHGSSPLPTPRKKSNRSPQAPAQPQKRPLTLRLLGGLVVYLATLYCGPVARTGKGRGREGAGLYPELAALGVIEGSSPALVSLVGRQCICCLPTKSPNRNWRHAAPRGHQGCASDRPAVGCRRADQPHARAARGVPATCRRGRSWRAALAAMVDGGRTRIRTVIRKQKGKGKGKSNAAVTRPSGQSQSC